MYVVLLHELSQRLRLPQQQRHLGLKRRGLILAVSCLSCLLLPAASMAAVARTVALAFRGTDAKGWSTMAIRQLYHQRILWVGDGTSLPDAILHIHAELAILLLVRVVTGRSLGRSSRLQ